MPRLDQNGTSVSHATALLRRAISKRVLVVEDEAFLALLMADQVSELGYRVVGPACTMPEARCLAQMAPIDGALLDLNLHGVLSHEIADILSRRKIPFAFITGYDEPPAGAYTDIDVLHKPYELISLARAIEDMLTKPPRHDGDGAERTNKSRIGVSHLQKF
jgi:CheY-like chemotaxis protein